MPTHTIKISPEINDLFKSLGEHLRYNGRFSIPKNLDVIISSYVNHCIKSNLEVIAAGEKFYRARIFSVDRTDPFPASEMGAPPREKLPSAGRINPEGISYLYLANSPEAAISEVRPWFGAKVAVGEFEIQRDIEVVDMDAGWNLSSGFSVDEIQNGQLGKVLIGHLMSSIYFSAPAHNEDKLAYLPTQYLSETFKNKGVTGLKYASVLKKDGFNLASFDVAIANCLSVDVYKVNEVSYDCSKL